MTIRAALSAAAGGAQEDVDALERALNGLARIGVGEPQITLAVDAEIGPADRRHARLLQQRRGERLRLPAGRRDVGESVESAFRRRRAYARQPIEPVDDDAAAGVEFGDHRGDRVLRPGQRGEAGELRRRIDAGVGIDRQLAHIVVERGGQIEKPSRQPVIA